MTGWIRAIADAHVYLALMGFLGLYPVVTGLYWIVGAVIFSAHRERSDDGFYELDEYPHVSVLVAAHNEEAVIGETVERLLELDWPAFDVTVVDDGSTDRTSELPIGLAEAGRIRLLTKSVNERRAQATWGRLTTFSGICTALRKSAIEDVGRFRVGMATEDIALAWQLQTAYADVRYEPRALFAMQVPETLPAWWSQRTRWSRGLAQVLRENARILRDVQARRMWPVWAEGLLSTLWSHLFFLAAAFWALALASGVYGFAGDPIPNFWGLLIASVLVVQISIGLSLDGRYDHSVRRYALWIPIYPLAYWMLSAAAAVRGTLPGLLRARSTAPVTWKQQRYHAK